MFYVRFIEKLRLKKPKIKMDRQQAIRLFFEYINRCHQDDKLCCIGSSSLLMRVGVPARVITAREDSYCNCFVIVTNHDVICACFNDQLIPVIVKSNQSA